uniref:GST N-terminal domain-containing protein n=1 Tax=Leersia perrieri TaxID=77586 RepID=A0A0D9W561_9ORYZ
MALEEKGIDYTSYHVNPLTGKNMNVAFFRMNPSAKLPVFQNGAHVIYRAFDIIQLAVHLSGEIAPVNTEVYQWMQKVDAWNPKMFTLTHTPIKYRTFVSKFIRRVLIARMAEAPDLASMYHVKLREAYETEDKLKDPEIMKQSEEELNKLLDDVEQQLNNGKYIAEAQLQGCNWQVFQRVEEVSNSLQDLIFSLHADLVQEILDELSEPVRGRKRGPKSSGNGNMEESPKIVSSFRNGEAAALTQYVVGSSCLK